MSDGWVNAIWILCVLGWIYHARWRSRKDFAEILKPKLFAHGLGLIKSIPPPPFVTGPFPQGVTEFAKGGSWLPYSCWQYRKVLIRDASGAQQVAWARIFFPSGSPPEVDWQPDLTAFKESQNIKSEHISNSAEAV